MPTNAVQRPRWKKQTKKTKTAKHTVENLEPMQSRLSAFNNVLSIIKIFKPAQTLNWRWLPVVLLNQVLHSSPACLILPFLDTLLCFPNQQLMALFELTLPWKIKQIKPKCMLGGEIKPDEFIVKSYNRQICKFLQKKTNLLR